jgi:hypothetical protein
MTQKQTILDWLWVRGWHPLSELLSCRHIAQYNARIKELRDAGFAIQHRRFNGRPYYRMMTNRPLIDTKRCKLKEVSYAKAD